MKKKIISYYEEIILLKGFWEPPVVCGLRFKNCCSREKCDGDPFNGMLSHVAIKRNNAT